MWALSRADLSGRALFPHYCVDCGREGPLLCSGCADDLLHMMTGVFLCPGCGDRSVMGRTCRPCSDSGTVWLDGSISCIGYTNVAMRRLLLLYKFEGVVDAGKVLSRVLRHFLNKRKSFLKTVVVGETVVAVPMHRLREALRGYNHSRILATTVTNSFGSVFIEPLIKTSMGPRQVELADIPSRKANIKGTFRANGEVLRKGVVLVDDVCTSMSTLQECAKVIKEAGGRSVWAITLMRKTGESGS